MPGVVFACLVNVTRLSIYDTHFFKAARIEGLALFLTAAASAFPGAFLGSRFLKKGIHDLSS
jgi:hypothetical protein